MNKKGSVLIISLLVIIALAGLSAVFLYKQVNQSLLVNRYSDSTRAFWLAEAGIQNIRSITSVLVVGPSGNISLGQGNYAYIINAGESVFNATTNTTKTYYPVNSRGVFGGVRRQINVVVEQNVTTTEIPAGNFPYGVQSTVEIEFKGSSTVAGETSPDPLPAKYRDADYYEENSVFSFPALFGGYSTNEVKALCMAGGGSFNFSNNTWPSGNITGVTWVTAPSSNFNGNAYGSGILIVEGNLRVTGTIDFDGIIYVLGELNMAGTATVTGSVLAESAATVDTTVTGTANILHNTTVIENALAYFEREDPEAPNVLLWQEGNVTF